MFHERNAKEAKESMKRDNPLRNQETTSGRWQIGDKIENRYEVHDIKGGEGKSGFGIVYICYDHESKAPFAIKTFQERFLSSQKARDDFTNEALTWIKLDKHKNIVKAHYVKNIEGPPYIFLEYVAGGNLDDWLYTKQLDLPLALNFAIQFCNGMDYAYKKMGLIHRDIKPGNILLTVDKTVKITDFGLAKAIEAKSEQIEVPTDVSYVLSSIAGSLPYMAPEQFTGLEIDARADIYAFGIVLYQMATNSYPYPRKNSWLEMHLKESPLPIKQNIPPELNVLIHKCLEKEPSRRYQNFSELKQELSKIYFDLTGKRIIEKTPEELDVWELDNKGATLSELGRLQEAVACFEKALEINPRFADAWSNKGNALTNLGRHQEAITCFDKALEINPRDAVIWNNKGVPLRELGRLKEAMACNDKALEINPGYAEAWNNKGIALRELDRVQEALACCDKALEINQRLSEAWSNKGHALGDLGRLRESVACYDTSLKINPRLAAAWGNKGTALYNLGRHQEAIACFDEVLGINSREAKAWYNKGLALGKLNRLKEAIACNDKALEINPRYAMAWYNNGIALRKLGRVQEALTCFDKALEINPSLAEAWGNKGTTLGDLGRYPESLACFDKVLEINSRDAKAWGNKGLSLSNLGKVQEAIICFDKALEINLRDAMAWSNKGVLLDDLGKHQEAIECFDKALEINPRLAAAWYSKGAALGNLGRYQEAILSFLKFIEFAPPQDVSGVKRAEEIIRQFKGQTQK